MCSPPPTSRLLLIRTILQSSKGKLFKKEAFQKANPACKISLNHPVQNNAHDMKDHLPTQGQVPHQISGG